MAYLKYCVRDSDAFDPDNYPQILMDIKQLKEETTPISSLSRGEILVSFTRKHSLAVDLIAQNPAFAKAIASGTLPLGNIELLFEASRRNPLFTQQLEDYLKLAFN